MWRKQQLIISVIALAMFFFVNPTGHVNAAGNGIVESGTYGKITWTFTKNRTLLLEGKGGIGFYYDDEGNTENLPWEKYIDQTKELEVREGITSLGDLNFCNNKTLTRVKLPGTIKYEKDINGHYIGEGAFRDCTVLKTVELGEGIRVIPAGMFAGCSSLRKIVLPQSLRDIQSGAFIDCSSLTDITIPQNVRKIHSNFSYCRKLKRINVDKKNTHFKSMKGILFTKSGKTLVAYPPARTGKTYTLPKSVTVVQQNAFKYLVHLNTLIIPKELKPRKRNQNTFEGSEIKKVILKEGITKTTPCMFDECHNLKEVVLPSTLRRISFSAFMECRHLSGIRLPRRLSFIGRSAFCGSGLKSVKIPENVTLIQGFEGCSKLKKIDIRCKRSYRIGEGAFCMCPFRTLTFPSGLAGVGARAFAECSKLKTVSFPKETFVFGREIFDDCRQLKTVTLKTSRKPRLSKKAFSNRYVVNKAGRYTWHVTKFTIHVKDKDVKNAVRESGYKGKIRYLN